MGVEPVGLRHSETTLAENGVVVPSGGVSNSCDIHFPITPGKRRCWKLTGSLGRSATPPRWQVAVVPGSRALGNSVEGAPTVDVRQGFSAGKQRSEERRVGKE